MAKTSTSAAQAQNLLALATGLSLGLNWDYNVQTLRALMERHAPDLELGLWWADGFVPVTDGAAEVFAPALAPGAYEQLLQNPELRQLPEVDRGAIAGLVANRQTQGGLLAAGPDAEAFMRVLNGPVALARLATALSEEVGKRTSTDKLTGLWNRQYFNERFREECERLVRSKETGSVAIIGLDNFGALARTMPTEEVNQLMSTLGVTVRQVIRQTDWAVRWDNFELLFYFPSTSAEMTLEVLKRFTKRVITAHPILEPLIGLASTVETTSPRALIQLGSRRLELARKDNHRRVICYATPAQGLQFWRGEGA